MDPLFDGTFKRNPYRSFSFFKGSLKGTLSLIDPFCKGSLIDPREIREIDFVFKGSLIDPRNLRGLELIDPLCIALTEPRKEPL